MVLYTDDQCSDDKKYKVFTCNNDDCNINQEGSVLIDNKNTDNENTDNENTDNENTDNDLDIIKPKKKIEN